MYIFVITADNNISRNTAPADKLLLYNNEVNDNEQEQNSQTAGYKA